MRLDLLIAAKGLQTEDRTGGTCEANNGFCPDWIYENFDRYVDPFVQHVFLTVTSVAIGFVIAFGLALLAHQKRWLLPPLSASSQVLYAVPSAALFLLLLPITGRGSVTGLIALVSYTLIFVFVNVTTGLDGVPEDSIDAARGMGLTERQLLWRVKVPLALPEIFAGLRIATTTTVGLAALAFLAGAGGLGEEINRDKGYQSNVAVAGGSGHRPRTRARPAHPDLPTVPDSLAEGGGVSAVMANAFNDFGDAINFLIEPQPPNIKGGSDVGGASEMFGLLLDHLALSAAAVGIGAVIAIPLGLYLGHHGKGEFAAINISNVGRAVPTLVLLTVFIAWIGVGFVPIMLSLALLALPPILTNTYVAVQQVERDNVDAARGMGMTNAQIIRQVELPLSLPTIFAGLRVSAVNVVATATIAPLGSATVARKADHLPERLRRRRARLGAAIAVTVLTLVVSGALGALQRAVTPEGLKTGAGKSRRRFLPNLRRREATTS